MTGDPRYPDLGRVLDTLAAARFDVDALDLADACWLAAALPAPPAPPPAAAPAAAPDDPAAPPVRPAPPSPAPLPPPRSPTALPAAEHRLYAAATAGATGGRSLVALPDPPALPDKLALGRALRPLRRRVPGRGLEVDVRATVARTAARWLAWADAPLVPAFRPDRARWLDAILLVDRSQTTAVWRRTVEEWVVVLQRLGAFRDLRVWHLAAGAAGPLVLAPGDDPRPPAARDVAELVDPSGRRLVMIASDCIDPRWSSPGFTHWLARQAAAGPLAILQLLPPHLWHRTMLARLPAAALTASAPGLPPHRLAATPLDDELAEDSDTDASSPLARALPPAIPVVPLRPDALAAWAQLTAGAATGRATGVRFEPTPTTPPPTAAVAPPTAAPDPAALVRRFLAGSTAAARKLAAYLAAVPLTGPVLRIVRQELVPEAREEHLVEVLFSRLVVQRAPDLWTVAPGDELYDFRPGVREELLGGLGRMTIEDIARAIGSYLERTRGAEHNFFASVYRFAAAGAPAGRPFATVSDALLRVLQPYRMLDDANESELRMVSVFAAPRDASRETNAPEAGPVPRENGMWILLEGDAPAPHPTFARELGTQLVAHGFSIVLPSATGLASGVALAFANTLIAQGYRCGFYRTRQFSAEAYAELSAAPGSDELLQTVDAVLLLGNSRPASDIVQRARKLGLPIAQPIELEPYGVTPPVTWTDDSAAAYARELAAWLVRRLGPADSPAAAAELVHQAAVALDEPELRLYRKRFAAFRTQRRTIVDALLASRLATDERRPSHRLAGYSAVASPPDRMMLALRLERGTLERASVAGAGAATATRTLHRLLEVLRTATANIGLGAARTRALAVDCARIARLLAAREFERSAECRAMLESLFSGGELQTARERLDRAAAYRALRRDLPTGPTRTRRMTDIVEAVQATAIAPATPEAERWFEAGDDGERIVALALVLGAPDRAAFQLVMQALKASRSAFEQFTAMCAIAPLVAELSSAQREQLRDELIVQRSGPPGMITVADRDRWHLSASLLDEIAALRGRAAPARRAPHTILVVAANPVTTGWLELDEDRGALWRELQATRYRSDFQIVAQWAASMRELVRHIAERKPSVLHFASHHPSSASLVLPDDDLKARPLSAPVIAELIAHMAGVRIVVLRGCYDKAQAEALSAGVDCVIGTTAALRFDATRSFILRFYSALASGRSATDAFGDGLGAIAGSRIPRAALPRLLIRDGTDPASLVLGPGSQEPSAGPTAPLRDDDHDDET